MVAEPSGSGSLRGEALLCLQHLTFSIFFIILALTLPGIAQAQTAPVLINAGGTAYKDTLGRNWAADVYFTGGSTFQRSVSIAGTVEDTLYRSERFGQFSYKIPVANGQKQVVLHFAELYFGANAKRVFNVVLEGQTVLTNLDIYAEAGKNKALTKTFAAAVADGFLDISFTPVIENPKISAIEILAGSSTNQAPVANAGPDNTITLPANSVSLQGSATDDGLPNPPAALAYSWAKTSGPGTVTFSSPNAAATNASFSAAGSYTLTLTASDSVLSGSDSVLVTVNPQSPANQAPAVNAGPDQSITLPANSVSLQGSATDDGLPNPPAALTYSWIKTSGPGTVTFSNASSASTNASFSAAGTYVLTLSASDSALSGSDAVSITVNSQPSGQQTVRINAGGAAYTDPDGNVWSADNLFTGGGTFSTAEPINSTNLDPLYQSERWGNFSYAIPLQNGSYSVTLHFAEIYFSSAGQRIFSVTAEGATVIANLDIFAQAGKFNALLNTFPVSIQDGVLNLSLVPGTENPKLSAIEILSSGSPANQAPTANAGADQTITLPANSVNLQGTAADDGLPNPPAALTYSWTKSSGPGTVSFGNANSAATSAVFSQAGTYVLTLSVSDSLLSSSDTVTVTVNSQSPSNQAPVVNAGPDQSITLPANSVSLQGSATDDALPNPPAALTYSWVKTTGPGTVTFANAASASTNASFSAAGTYVLTLSASDSALSGSDAVSITVNPQPSGQQAIRINAGGPSYTDGSNQVWQADTLFSGGSTYGQAMPISGTTDDVLYQTERYGAAFSYAVAVPNGQYAVVLHFAEIYFSTVGSRVFDVAAEGVLALDNLDLVKEAGKGAAVVKLLPTVAVADGVLNLAFTSVVENAKVSAIEILPVQPPDHVLHVVIDTAATVVDYNGSGGETILLDGSASHTHELGVGIASYIWKEGAATLGSGPQIATALPVGQHTISLTITDNAVPAKSLTGQTTVNIYPITAVGGLLAEYYPANGQPLSGLVENVPSSPEYIERLSTAAVTEKAGKVSGSPYSGDVLVVLTGKVQISSAGTYLFTASGQGVSKILLDGTVHTAATPLSAGSHSIEARLAIASTTSLPREVLVSNGGAAAPIAASALTHDESQLHPVINSLQPPSGAPGTNIALAGLGFAPGGPVTVNWGSSTITTGLTISPEKIEFPAPAGSGVVPVSVTTSLGSSNIQSFSYTGGGPITFVTASVAEMTSPTQAAWGPDGRLYVGSITGAIQIFTFDSDYTVTAVQSVAGVSNLSNSNILGIGFNPFDTSGSVKLYVAHSQLYANGGSCFTGFSPYSGQISMLQGPNFTTVTPVVTGLPVSNHDHGVNGLQFDNNGDLLVAVGGVTNAGVPYCALGGLPESPFSGAIVKVSLTSPTFQGAINYKFTSSGSINNNQVNGGQVDPVSGLSVAVFAPGLRNPFDLVFTSSSLLYASDNGPDPAYGPASTSATTDEPVADTFDELNLIAQGNYYGHPNRNRGRYNSRENIYRSPDIASISGVYTGPVATLQESSNGIDEYRATTFASQMRGRLLVQRWDQEVYVITLSTSGNTVQNIQLLSGGPAGLDILAGPGGAIVGIDYSQHVITVSKPVDSSAPATAAFDIFPWRAPADGSALFTIGGKGFGSLANTTVTIGGAQAVLQSVTPTRIKGTVPASANPTSALLDVVVQSNGATSTISKAFRYIFH